MRGVRFEIVSRPGKDILYGVDALVRDGIADPKRLTIGGYSYGGYLTNWLITQTNRFNAALSGSAAPEHVADWGLTDIPLTSVYFFGGFPWQVPCLYQKEAAIFQLDKVRTPTHIVVPAKDIRVSSTENYILERGLYALNIPTKLIVLPDEPHWIKNNPWHEKIKVREEIKWLQKYGNTSLN
jgi:dipeptidyl aminopeptidase/acylaminoacyl peptidase